MIRLLLILIVGLIFGGCGKAFLNPDKSVTNYEVDKTSFTTNDLEMIATNTGIHFPEGTEGVNLLYKGEFHGPNLLAKVEIPTNAEAEIIIELNKVQNPPGGYDSAFTNQVNWWDGFKGRTILDKVGRNGRDLTHIILSEQTNHLFLYIEWYY